MKKLFNTLAFIARILWAITAVCLFGASMNGYAITNGDVLFVFVMWAAWDYIDNQQ